MDGVQTELDIELDTTQDLATAEHTLWDVGFLSHLEHAAGPVPDPFPDPLPGPFPDPPGRGFSGPCDRSQIARTHTALRPWQVPMGFEMAGFPPAIYLPTIKKSERCSKLIFPQQRGDSSLCLSRLKRLWWREIASRGEEKSSSHHEFFVPWNELFSSNL